MQLGYYLFQEGALADAHTHNDFHGAPSVCPPRLLSNLLGPRCSIYSTLLPRCSSAPCSTQHAVQLLTMCCWASQATAPAATPVSTPVQHQAEEEEDVFDVEAVRNLVGQYPCAKYPYYAGFICRVSLIMYMQSVLIMYCCICKVSLLCTAVYAKCPYYVLLYMQSVLII